MNRHKRCTARYERASRKSLWKKIGLAFGVLCVTAAAVTARERITLQYCFDRLYSSYPTAANEKYRTIIANLNKKIINSDWYPQVNVSSQFSRQSDNVPILSKDKYQFAFSFEQLLFDGSYQKKSKLFEEQSLIVEQLKIKRDIYLLKNQVAKYFFGVLFAEKQIKILELMQTNLMEKIAELDAAVKNGARLKSDLLIIESELLTVSSKIIEQRNLKQSNIEILAELTGCALSGNDTFTVPVQDTEGIAVPKRFSRIEFDLFAAEKNKIRAADKLVDTSTKPRIHLFTQVGYSKPGLNFLVDEPDNFYIGGIRVSWKPVDWSAAQHNHAVATARIKIIDSRQKEFEKKLKMSLYSLMSDINNLNDQLKKDAEQIRIKTEILNIIEAQFENGLVTATEYMINSNKLLDARKIRELHIMQRLYLVINYKILVGNKIL